MSESNSAHALIFSCSIYSQWMCLQMITTIRPAEDSTPASKTMDSPSTALNGDVTTQQVSRAVLTENCGLTVSYLSSVDLRHAEVTVHGLD